MNIKIAMLMSLILLMAGCDKSTTPLPSAPIQNGPISGSRSTNYAIASALEQQGVYSQPYDKQDEWTLNGITGENYYVTLCGPTQDCKAPLEHISIYTYKSLEERDKGLADFKDKRAPMSTVAPLIWQNKNSLFIYWHTSPIGQSPVLSDKISTALKGWHSVTVQ